MAPRLIELLGDGARAEGFEEMTRFLEGIAAQNPTGLADDELSFVRLMKIMVTAATEGAKWIGRSMEVIGGDRADLSAVFSECLASLPRPGDRT